LIYICRETETEVVLIIVDLKIVDRFQFVEQSDESLRSRFSDPVEENRFRRPDEDPAVGPGRVRNPDGQAVKVSASGRRRAHRNPGNGNAVEVGRFGNRQRNLDRKGVNVLK